MYEHFYGLKSRPFQLMPDPRFLYEASDHKRALSYLVYGLERREGFVIITGDVGTGKTLLLQTMLNETRTQHLSVARVSLANLDAPSVLASVAGAFGVAFNSHSKFELMDALVRRLAPSKTGGSLLIVDEAQSCTPEALEELRAISNLQANGRALVQIFLIGQTELRDLLSQKRMSHLRQRIVASHHLKPLGEDEVGGYIEHRLTLVGRQDKPTFGEGVFGRVFEWSKGIPRRINLLMDRLLLYGYLENKTHLVDSDLNTVIEEFEDEFSDELLVQGNELSPAPDAPQSIDEAESGTLSTLNERMAAIEEGLRNVFGSDRAEAIMRRHRLRTEHREVVETRMRLTSLESVFNELQSEPATEQKSEAAPASKPSKTKKSSKGGADSATTDHSSDRAQQPARSSASGTAARAPAKSAATGKRRDPVSVSENALYVDRPTPVERQDKRTDRSRKPNKRAFPWKRETDG